MVRVSPFAARLRGRREPDPGAASPLTACAPLSDNPGSLAFFEFIPPNLAPPAPLVVVVHGCTQTAAGYDAASGWTTLAARHGFALLFAQQDRSNNAQGCFNWFEPGDTRRGGGEAQSIARAVAAVVAAHRLDAARVFVTGLSAGGAMASALCAAYPDVFAGASIIAGLPAGSAASVNAALGAMRVPPSVDGPRLGDRVRAASRFDGPWPRVLIWHGDADTTVVPANADALAAQWCDVHGVIAAPVQRVDGLDTVTRWANAGGVVVVERHMIAGMAHGTPTDAHVTGTAAAPFMLDVGIDSSAAALGFWGIATQPAAVARKHSVPSPAAPPPRAEPSPRATPFAAIQAALRAAGLTR